MAGPAKSVVGSWAWSQSSERPRQSSCSRSAVIPGPNTGPNTCSTGLVVENYETEREAVGAAGLAVEQQCHGRRPHADVPPMPGLLPAEPVGDPNLAIDSGVFDLPS